MLWPKSRSTALKSCRHERWRCGIDLIAAAFAGLLMAAMWPAFDESGRFAAMEDRRAVQRVQGNEVFDDFVGVRPFWKSSAVCVPGDDAVAGGGVRRLRHPLHAEADNPVASQLAARRSVVLLIHPADQQRQRHRTSQGSGTKATTETARAERRQRRALHHAGQRRRDPGHGRQICQDRRRRRLAAPAQGQPQEGLRGQERRAS